MSLVAFPRAGEFTALLQPTTSMLEYSSEESTMTRHKVYPVVKVYKESDLLRTTTVGSRSKIDEAMVEINCDIGDNSDVKVTAGVKVDEDGHGYVCLNLDGNLFDLSINGKAVTIPRSRR